jgi:hypothetical protein
MISQIYSKSSILSSPAIQAQISSILFCRLLPLLEQEAASASSDGTKLHPIILATSTDVISAYIFGHANGTSFIQDKDSWYEWKRLCDLMTKRTFWVKELPGLTALCSKLGIRLCPTVAEESLDKLRCWIKGLCDTAHSSLSARSLDPYHPVDEPVVFKAYHVGLDKETKKKARVSLQRRPVSES